MNKKTQQQTNGIILYIIRKAEKNNLFFTPLGQYTAGILDVLLTHAVLKPCTHDTYYIWNDDEGKKEWDRIRRFVREKFLTGNQMYEQQKGFFRDIDFLLTYKNKEYTFAPKPMRSLKKWEEITENTKITEKDKKDIAVYLEWEALL